MTLVEAMRALDGEIPRRLEVVAPDLADACRLPMSWERAAVAVDLVIGFAQDSGADNLQLLAERVAEKLHDEMSVRRYCLDTMP